MFLMKRELFFHLVRQSEISPKQDVGQPRLTNGSSKVFKYGFQRNLGKDKRKALTSR